MKILRALFVVDSEASSACPDRAATTIDFGTPSGNLGNSHTHPTEDLSVVGSGFKASNGATALFGKNAGLRALLPTLHSSGEHSFATGDDR